MNKHRFVWHDLNTRDPEAAKKFYGDVFSWTFSASDGGPYVHIAAGEHMIGGIRKMDANEPGPTSWLGYIAVDDVAATVAKIGASKGKVFVPTTAMPNVGTFAVTADPTGAVFAPWKSARPGEDAERSGPPARNTFCWDELVTTDPAAAAAFYGEVLGWKARAVDMGPAGTYTLLDRPGVTNAKGEQVSAAGVMKAPPGVPHSFWIAYVHVDDADASCERARKLGATVTIPPTDIPNIGRFACWLDPQQAGIAILQPS
ncbi:MAG: VOC family protein [Deltaproteobacteria bacterium]|nr:VOC family protein [Deltaproteobacteria bacterium]